MNFKKHNWMTFYGDDLILEIAIREFDNRKIDFFRTNSRKEARKIAKLIREKYGFDLTEKDNLKEKDKKKRSSI